jgi:hypothetical protein
VTGGVLATILAPALLAGPARSEDAYFPGGTYPVFAAPNPFFSSTTLHLEVARPGHVVVRVFDAGHRGVDVRALAFTFRGETRRGAILPGS